LPSEYCDGNVTAFQSPCGAGLSAARPTIVPFAAGGPTDVVHAANIKID
jgi:tripartite-type tricarboxylate transporter receptor subunit TctC